MDSRARGPLVGRDDELASLRSALDESAAGRGRVVVVSGETGIGKTRLLQELARAAGDTHVVLTGRAVEGGGAYRPVADALVGAVRVGRTVEPGALGGYAPALARLLPDWAEVAGGAPEAGVDPGLVLGEAVARFLAIVGQGKPCLLLLEDLQWADADSLAVVSHLAAAVTTLPVLVVASAREDEPGHGQQVTVRGADLMRLGRLTREDVRRLATHLQEGDGDPEVLALLEERADGLPFLVEELVDRLDGATPGELMLPASSLPPTLLALVADRLAGLSPAQRRVLDAAAVLGLAPDWSLLGVIAQSAEADVLDALRAAEDARLLDASSGALTWRHALTRDAVLAGVLPPERSALGRRGAEALLARGRPDDDAAAADLLLKAGADDAAADLVLTLVRRNVSRGAFRTAEGLLADLDRTGTRPVAAATERVRLLSLTGRAAPALGAGAAALDLARGEEHVELSFGLAHAAVQAGRWDLAREYVGRAGRPDDPRSPTLLADAAHGAGDMAGAASHAAEATTRAEAAGTPEQLCEALVVEAKVLRFADPAAARARFDRAAQVAAEHALVAARVEAMLGQATVSMLEDEDAQWLAAPRELAAQAGLLGQVTGIDMLAVDTVLVTEGPEAAVPLAEALVERGRTLAMPVASIAGLFVLGLAAAAAGDRAETARLVALLPAEGAGPRESSMLPAAVGAMLALSGHDLRGANAALDSAVAPVVGHLSAAPLHQYGLWALLRTAVDDRGDEARRVLAGVPVARRRANASALRYADAVALGRESGSADAAAALGEAESLAAATPWLRRLLRTVALDRAVADGWGDPVPLLRASLAEHEQAGEEALARVVRDLLRLAGAPTRRGRGDSSVPAALAALGVTSREADVLTLVVEGATNAEIAERLFLSRRTVETHVAHLLQKTSSASRAELRDRVAALDP